MGREGEEEFLENYSLSACAPRLLSILTRAMEEHPGGERKSIERSDCQLCQMGDWTFPFEEPILDTSRWMGAQLLPPLFPGAVYQTGYEKL